jgi:hypothetical protein
MIWRSENYWPYQDSNSEPLNVQPIASHYTNYDNMTQLVMFLLKYEIYVISRIIQSSQLLFLPTGGVVSTNVASTQNIDQGLL